MFNILFLQQLEIDFTTRPKFKSQSQIYRLRLKHILSATSAQFFRHLWFMPSLGVRSPWVYQNYSRQEFSKYFVNHMVALYWCTLYFCHLLCWHKGQSSIFLEASVVLPTYLVNFTIFFLLRMKNGWNSSFKNNPLK